MKIAKNNLEFKTRAIYHCRHLNRDVHALATIVNYYQQKITDIEQALLKTFPSKHERFFNKLI